jgi:hypothetical protein
MKIKTAELQSERLWRAATGMDQARFAKLLVIFIASYRALFAKSVAERQADLEVTPSLQTEEELLLFTLFSLKSGLTYDLLGLACGMSGSNAVRNQQLGLRVLQHALQSAGLLPKREFANAEEFAEYLKNEPTLILDVTEQRTQRPCENAAQRDLYSGKKKPVR